MPTIKTRLLFLILLVVGLGLRAETVRVASFNVRNYNVCDRLLDGKWTPAYPKPEDEKTALRAVLRAVNPDVVMFQEMGLPEFLEELRLDLAKEGLDYPYSAHMIALDEDRCLCALSRIPFAGVDKYAKLSYSIKGKDYGVKRGLIALSFTTQGRAWTMYGIHLKSRYGSEKDAAQNRNEREGEATAVRNRIARNGADGMWILAGDTNDTPGSGTWKRLSRKGDAELGTALRALDSNGEAWTYHYASHDVYERIDMLMCSPSMCAIVVKGSARIYDGPDAKQASDHRLIYMDIEFPDAQTGPKADKVGK